MAKVKCAYGKRARATHEWNDGEKDRIYCCGRVDLMTDELLDVCRNCKDCVIYAQQDLDEWNRSCKKHIGLRMGVDKKTCDCCGETDYAYTVTFGEKISITLCRRCYADALAFLNAQRRYEECGIE